MEKVDNLSPSWSPKSPHSVCLLSIYIYEEINPGNYQIPWFITPPLRVLTDISNLISNRRNSRYIKLMVSTSGHKSQSVSQSRKWDNLEYLHSNTIQVYYFKSEHNLSVYMWHISDILLSHGIWLSDLMTSHENKNVTKLGNILYILRQWCDLYDLLIGY